MTQLSATDPWERYLMALDEVSNRLDRVTRCLDAAEVP